MITLNTYLVLHLSSIIVLLGYTFYAFAAPAETRIRVLMITGTAAILIAVTGFTSPELPIAARRNRKGILDGGPTSPSVKARHPAVFEVLSITALCLGNITGAKTGAGAARP